MGRTLTAVSALIVRAVFLFRVVVILGATLAIAPNATAEQQSGCFVGKDHLGYPANVRVSVERYGDWYEVSGVIYSSGANRVFRFKADGYSGAGRLFEGHEYESGALYISVQELTENTLVLEVESYGVFHFRRARC